MKKDPCPNKPQADTDLRRRQLLAFLGLAGTAGVAWPHGRDPSHPCLLSLREADFYARHDLAG